MDNVLITINDAKLVRNLFTGFSQTEFDSLLLEIQEFYLQPLLGVELYLDVLENSSSYDDLLNGLYYDYSDEKYHMQGVKKYLSYLFFYKFSMEGAVKYTQSGMKDFNMDYSERSPKGKDQNVIDSHLSKSQVIGKEIKTYLERNTDIYDLYIVTGKKEIQNTDFNLRAFGETQTPITTI